MIQTTSAESTSFPIRGALDLALTLRRLRHGLHDPTIRVSRAEAWRATRTPEGAATTRFLVEGDTVRVTAWGPGARWAVSAAPALLGLADDPGLLEPHHDVVAELKRRLSGLRIGRSGAVLEALIPAIIEQKVTGLEAWRAHAALVRAYGEPAPGPGRLRVPPSPAVLARLPYYAFHRLGLERRRADTIRRACAVNDRLEEIVDMPPADATRRLTAIPGVGQWTAAEVVQTALGDPDTVSVGDYGLPSLVAWVLAGEPEADDARMLELLEPYRGQRSRVVRLIEAGAGWRPRRAPWPEARSIAAI